MKVIYITDVATKVFSNNISGHVPSYILDKLQNKITVYPVYSKSRFSRGFLKLFVETLFKTIIYKPDIIHGIGANTNGLIAVLVGFLSKAKTVVQARGSDVNVFPNKNWFCKSLVKFVLRHADGIICTGYILKEKIISFDVDSSKINVIYSGVSKIFFVHHKNLRKKLNLPQNRKIIISVGRLTELKGIQDVLSSLSKVNDNWLFLIVGNGYYEDKLKQLTKDLKIEDKVRFTGLVMYEKLPLYYQASDMCIFTSYSEGNSMVLLEAMASGLPVISSKVGDAPLLLKEGILVDAGNQNQITKALKKMLNSETKVKSHKFKNFRREDVPQKVIEVYKEVLG